MVLRKLTAEEQLAAPQTHPLGKVFKGPDPKPSEKKKPKKGKKS